MYHKTDYLEFAPDVYFCLLFIFLNTYKGFRRSHSYIAININCGAIIVQIFLHKILESGNRTVIMLHVMCNIVERI